MESQRLTFCSSHYDLTELDDWFNITATFKSDSTVYIDYKEFRNWNDIELNKDYLVNFERLLKKQIDPIRSITDLSVKNNFVSSNLLSNHFSPIASVVVFISHCETFSRRENYINELLNYINIDIYGNCNRYFPKKHIRKNSCGPFKNNNNSICMNDLLNKYKFYLSFENSMYLNKETSVSLLCEPWSKKFY